MHTKLEYIKNYFLNNFEEINYDWLHKEQPIQHPIHNGKQIVTYAVLHNLVRAFKPKKILEIGTWEYHSANVMALASDSVQELNTFDIRSGGYNGNLNAQKRSDKIRNWIWRPYHTSYDEWKYNNADIKDFINMDNKHIYALNLATLKTITGYYEDNLESGYDLIFVDGDHSKQGLEYDLKIVSEVANEDAIIVIDNILDERLKEVNQVWNDLVKTHHTYDFNDWNLREKNRIIEMGIILPYDN